MHSTISYRWASFDEIEHHMVTTKLDYQNSSRGICVLGLLVLYFKLKTFVFSLFVHEIVFIGWREAPT